MTFWCLSKAGFDVSPQRDERAAAGRWKKIRFLSLSRSLLSNTAKINVISFISNGFSNVYANDEKCKT